MTIDDFMVLFGILLFVTGLALLDWRIALAAAGLLVALVGALRLRGGK